MAPADKCDPVTNAGCPTDGSACDIGPDGTFECFAPPNTVDVCGPCDGTATTCGPDLTCVLPGGGGMGACFRYCCTDADCGSGGTCNTAFGASVLMPANKGDVVGLCVADAQDDPSCGAPTGAPSGGSCVKGFSSGSSTSSSSSGSHTTSSSSSGSPDGGTSSSSSSSGKPDGGTSSSSSSGGTSSSSTSGSSSSGSSSSGTPDAG